MAIVGWAQVGTSSIVQACTSSDGVSWSGPVTIGQGNQPAVAIAPDGRIVAIWSGGPVSKSTTSIRASVRPPGGSWSAPVNVSNGEGRPEIGMDASGNAVAVWAAFSLIPPVQTASLPAGGSWTKVHTLAAQGGGVNMAVNSVGGVVATWRSGSFIEAASGTILGGFGAAVQVGPTYEGVSELTSPHVALNDAGAAFIAWDTHDSDVVVTRNSDGTWSALTTVSPHPGVIRIAVDGAGDALVVFEQTTSTGNPTYASLRPAGGNWGPPTALSSLTDSTRVGSAAGDANGTFVAAWTSGAGVVEALTIPPGGGIGPSDAVGNGPFITLQLVPGHAAIWMGAGISTDTVN
jgi:hypothetical protein